MKKVIQINNMIINNTSKARNTNTVLLPPIQRKVTNLSIISQNNSAISQLTLSKTSLDTYHTSTSNSNVNKILVNLQDRPSQIVQATLLGNTWSDQNRESSSEDLQFDMEKLRQIQLNGSMAVFDSDFETEFEIESVSDE
ncbi:Hypothetical_protein [Hexamita inflata]|uniref:Hypothetical_protein n=1 Tax=Hexamita inflata TaxID=28002 RepID=A0AA86R0W3_9EUKA|nr:Hypothetical protein HINF_LOCUS51084 [Hexamita inflata]